MSESVSAAIYIRESAFNYAEVLWEDGVPSLRRLGRQTFDFPLTHVLWGEEASSEALDRIETLLGQKLGDTEASEISIVFSSHRAFSFFLPIADSLSEQECRHQVYQQTALVTGTRSLDSLCISSNCVRTVHTEGEESIKWIHVLAVPQAVDDNLKQVLTSLRTQSRRLTISSKAAAHLMECAEEEENSSRGGSGAPGGYSLAVGQYSSHTEYVLTRDQAWYHAGVSPETKSPQDRVYFAVGVLNRIEIPVRKIDRVYLYGDDATQDLTDPIVSVFGVQPESLDPVRVFPASPQRLEKNSAGAYVPCIGAALGDRSSA